MLLLLLLLLSQLQLYMSVTCALLWLVQVTDESHPDKPHLIVAITAMTEVAAAINEFKRRKDLGTCPRLV